MEIWFLWGFSPLRMYTEYNESRQEAYTAAENFKAGIEEVIDDLVKTAMRGLVSSSIKLMFGIVPCRSGVSQEPHKWSQ